MEELISRFGLLAIFVGAALEGEPFVLAGGVLAHRQFFLPMFAVVAASGGGFCIDQFWFHLSRRFRNKALIQRMIARPSFRKALALLERHPVPFILLFRFAYGLRAVSTVALGASGISARLFILLDLFAALLWGTLYSAIGYFVGEAFETAPHPSILVVLSVIISATAIFMVSRRDKA